jgi:hypothetical protein
MRTNERGDSLCGDTFPDAESSASLSDSFHFTELKLEAITTNGD